MLAETSPVELAAEIFQRALIALTSQTLTLPFLKRVRTAAANAEMVFRRRLWGFNVLHGRKLGRRPVNIAADARGHLQHTFGDIIVLNFSRSKLGLNGVYQCRSSPT